MSLQSIMATLFGEQAAERAVQFFTKDDEAGADEDGADIAKFSTWLPYRAFDAEREAFVLADGIGTVIEALPQSGADQTMADLVRGLFVAPWPAGASLQINLFGTPHIKPLLMRYAA
nr:TraC family protein [Zoogloeaceae bacterium]